MNKLKNNKVRQTSWPFSVFSHLVRGCETQGEGEETAARVDWHWWHSLAGNWDEISRGELLALLLTQWVCKLWNVWNGKLKKCWGRVLLPLLLHFSHYEWQMQRDWTRWDVIPSPFILFPLDVVSYWRSKYSRQAARERLRDLIHCTIKTSMGTNTFEHFASARYHNLYIYSGDLCFYASSLPGRFQG